MAHLIDELTLERTGPAEATVGMISLPLPRDGGADLAVDHPGAAMQPVGWWERDVTARRSIVYVVDEAGAPETLSLKRGASTAEPSDAWSHEAIVTLEKLDFKHHPFTQIADLIGVPPEDCTRIEGAAQLTFGGRTIAIQCGATGPDGSDTHLWQNVMVDPLWANSAAQGIRVGGVIYNGDTYLWADVYIVLFAHGVASVSAHFFNSRLHIEGYPFHGLPFVRIYGDGLSGAAAGEHALPEDGMRQKIGGLELNLEDSATLCSAEDPGRLVVGDGELVWYPVNRTYNPWLDDTPRYEWPVGYGRTFRFQFSLADAAPVVARYRAPAWWYAECGEPWGYGFLPVRGRFHHFAENVSSQIQKELRRGRFDAGYGDITGDGETGTGLMINYYLTGRAELLESALEFGHYWNDLHVDHCDFTVRQHLGGFGWKTCAYTKFRDLIFTYLETGDPHLLDTMENVAGVYWAWFRANWPRNTVGRDNFEVASWALMARYFDSEQAKQRVREFVRMNGVLIESRGNVGGQIGGGPHPGFHASLYMTEVTFASLLEAAAAMSEYGDEAGVEAIRQVMRPIHAHYNRDDVELFPSNYGQHRAEWSDAFVGLWVMAAIRLYSEWPRFSADDSSLIEEGWAKIAAAKFSWDVPYFDETRPAMFLVNPWYADVMITGARREDDGIALDLVGRPDDWPAEQMILTPFGELSVTIERGDGKATFGFTADRRFPVSVRYGGVTEEADSSGTVKLAID
ncbi:MAG: hypothetical protein CMJ49_03855 [Planctomycetaceae bacterium]|nr:hypothetical protein [Planctomycetaceae bacterium]